MTTRPWMPLYVNDFRLDTLDLDAAQTGVYLIILMLTWRREDAALPDDMDWLKRTLKTCIADFHGHEFNRIVPGLLTRYFQRGDDGKWRNKRLTNERQKADKFSVKQKQNADKRWSDNNQNNGLRRANAMPSQSQSHTQRKEDAADAAPGQEVDLFRRGKAILGDNAGGLISQLLAAKEKNIALARAAIEQASTKENPREYIGAIIRGAHDPPDRQKVDPRL